MLSSVSLLHFCNDSLPSAALSSAAIYAADIESQRPQTLQRPFGQLDGERSDIMSL
jgi:hypothetical protein